MCARRIVVGQNARGPMNPPGLFLRDASVMGTQLGSHTVRIAVKDAATNRHMAATLAEVLYADGGASAGRSPAD